MRRAARGWGLRAASLLAEATIGLAAAHFSAQDPPAPTMAGPADAAVLRLIGEGDPARAIAPCGSCHLTGKAPALEGQHAA